MIESLARVLVPHPLWRRLRAWKMQRILSRFRPYLVEHDYAGVRLKVRIADPLARGWYDHPWEPMHEVDLLRSAGLGPGARVFDVGAHQGVVAMILAHHVGPAGEVVAIEALPHNAQMCEANRDLNSLRQIRVESAAIADHPGELEVTIDLNAHVGHRTSTITTVRVPAVTIDDLADKYGQPDVLFIDVEGYECHALRAPAEFWPGLRTATWKSTKGVGLNRPAGRWPVCSISSQSSAIPSACGLMATPLHGRLLGRPTARLTDEFIWSRSAAGNMVNTLSSQIIFNRVLTCRHLRSKPEALTDNEVRCGQIWPAVGRDCWCHMDSRPLSFSSSDPVQVKTSQRGVTSQKSL